MKLVIEIDEKTYNEIMDDAKNTPRNLSHAVKIIDKYKTESEVQDADSD